MTYPPPREDKPIGWGGREAKPPVEIKEEQLAFGEFAKLLGELQRKDKISGEQFRQNRELWNNYPQDRQAQVERLRKMLS